MVTGYPATAQPLSGPVLIDQHWADLTFLHWPVDPRSVAHLYPAGTRPDIFADGQTYVGLVAFTMQRTAVGAAIPLPYFGSFAETNIRLYSVDDAGRHGVLFRSLETARLPVVALLRAALGVPYTWARMRVMRSDNRVTYQSVRRWPRRGLRNLVTIVVGDEVEPTPLEVWLTARWGAHTRKAGRTWWVPNEHGTWPLRSAEIVELHDDLVTAAGVTTTGEGLRPLFSAGVHVQFGRPQVLR
jgi:uncharacterized protein YqjF (DUF2071 family)